MPLKIRKFEQILQGKFGFVPAKHRSDDHRWYEKTIPGCLLATYVSHGDKELSSNLEGKIARQLRVRKLFFQEMFTCEQDANAYHKQLQEDPYPPFHVRF